MGLTKLAIRRPLTMLMIILGLVVIGYRSFTLLQVDRFPKIDLPYVTVVTVFPGASPEDVEELVVKPIEDTVAGISGIDRITAQANEGYGVVVLAFVEGTDGNQAAIDVERQVATIRSQLPDDAEEPSIIKADINATPIIQIALSGPQGQDALFEIAENDIKSALQTVPGVASVNVSGGRDREIQVYANPARLAAFGLPLESVRQALTLDNVTFPVGSMEVGRQKSSVRSVGEFSNLQEIEDAIVSGSLTGAASGNRGLVYLRNVASVQEGLADQSKIVRYNGLDAVNITIVKTSDANTIQVADEVRQAVAELNAKLPAGAKMTIVIDNSTFTRESVAAVEEDLTLAILITGLVMLLFLHTIRSTFIVLLAIPTSIISTFLVMWALGFSLNTLTLMALTLVIGILVDDSIVVLENIERHLKLDKNPWQAALDGRAEIGLAAITITLVDVVVYLPVAFTSGLVGQFFRSYGITIATATLLSLFVSFTLTPLLASRWLKDEREPQTPPTGWRKVVGSLLRPLTWFWNGFIRRWEAGFDALANQYATVLRWVLTNALTQSLAVLIAVAALAAGIYLVVSGVVGSEFLPLEDDGQFLINIEMPAGTNLDATDQAARQVEQIIRNNVPETVAILTNVGSGASNLQTGASSSPNLALLTVRLVDKARRERGTTEIGNSLRPLLKEIPEAIISLNRTSLLGNSASQIELQIYGSDQNVLIDLANQVAAIMRATPGAVDVINTDAARSPETRLVIDRTHTLHLGLSPRQIAGTLRTAVNGSQAGQYQPEGQDEIDIILRTDESIRNDLGQLLQLPLGYVRGQPVRLDQVAEVEYTQAPARITRTDRERTLKIKADAAGRGAADVANEIEAAIKKQVAFPAGYGYDFVGTTERQRDSFAQMGAALGLSIVLIYMLLVALYQSWLHPLAIMFSLPVTLVGAFGGLWLTGNTLNMISILGIILLAGVVTKNAILLVDFTNILRQEQGYSRKTALVEAGRLRLRPILMTTAAIVFALLPLLFGQGAGSEVRAPLAAAVVGGNISSTLLTLILVPVVYNFLDWGGGLVSATLRHIFGTVKREYSVSEGEAPQPEPGVS